MSKALNQICLLAQMVSGAMRVSIARRDYKEGKIYVFASSRGQEITRDIKTALPLLSKNRPELCITDIRKLREFDNHPILEIFPSLRSVHAFHLLDEGNSSQVCIVWNPPQDYFENSVAMNTIQHLMEVVSAILKNPDEAENQLLELNRNQDPIHEMQEVGTPFLVEPTTQFLIETLIQKQRLLARNGASYLSLRQWRKPIKPYQISALTAIKRHKERPIAELIAEEMAATVKRVFGDNYKTIVPVPCGSSGMEDCLSVQIAELLARKLKAKFANVLTGGNVSTGASHPAKSAKLQPYKLTGSPTGPILIVDDVATSGRHMELAHKALSSDSNHCTGLVWIAD